jgi:hypothetical protein
LTSSALSKPPQKKKARKQREKQAAEGATADGRCAQQVAEPHAKKMTKKQ